MTVFLFVEVTCHTMRHSIKNSTLEDHYPQKFKYPFWIKIYLVKVPLNLKIVQQVLLHRKQLLKNLWSEVRKGEI